MKKLFSICCCLALAGCIQWVDFMPFSGTKYVKGEGGFILYENEHVQLYQSGLPLNAQCTVLGRTSTYTDGGWQSSRSKTAAAIYKNGGNVGSKSPINISSELKDSSVSDQKYDQLSSTLSGGESGLYEYFIAYRCE